MPTDLNGFETTSTMSLIEPSAMRKNWEIEWDQLDGPEYAAYFDAQFGEATKTRSGSFLLLPRALQKQKTAAHLRWALTKPDSHNTGSEIGGTPGSVLPKAQIR